MNRLRCLLALSLGICALSAAPDASADAACRVTGSDMSFGSVAASGATDAVGYIAYECDVSSPGNSGQSVSLKMCVGLGATPGGSLTDRRMDGIDDAVGPNPDQLPFQLYKDAARSSAWGESATSSPTYLETPAFTVTPPPGAVETVTGSIPVYGRIPGNLAAAGDYAASLPGTLYYGSKNKADQVDCMGADGSTGGIHQFPLAATATVPGSCSVVTASDMSFNPGGMPLTGTRTGNLASTSTIDLACTRRTTWQVGLDEGLHATASGARRMCNPGGACIAYRLDKPDGSTPWGDDLDIDTVEGTSTGTNQSLTVHGSVVDQPLLQAGRYSDTVKVVLTY